MADFWSWDGDDLLLRVRVQPKAARDQIGGLHGEALKVRITAPPAEGRANQHLVKLFAKELGLARSDVSVERGQKGRDKVLRCRGVGAGGFAAARERWEV